MDINDLILVSVDDHVVEPPDMFAGRLPARYADQAPKVITKDDGTDAWVFEGQEATNVGLNAVAGRPPDEYGAEPTRFSEIRPGCFDIHERIRDMNAGGLAASMNFPSYPQFCGQYFARAGDKDLALAVLRAYNDWHLDEWCGTYPGRMIPLALPPIWDPTLMAQEVRRVAAKGCHAVTFSENPEKLGYPSLHSDHWDPFWQACSDQNTVVCLHIGSSSQVVVTSLDAPVDTMITLQPMSIVQAAADLIWSPFLRRFPDLTLALSEGGIGWIPYFLERVDRVYKQHRAWTHQDFGDMLPSELFLQRIVTCFIEDEFGVASREKLNIDMVTWECDYPHSDSSWPLAPESLGRCLGGVPDRDVAKITHENALRLFSFDLFSHLPGEQATVGALRARAGDVDLGYRSSERLRKVGTAPVSVLDLARQLPTSGGS
ncbi:Predicted metal-dependent hydrolase, TIM-barrel fold [Parafrankia irregularis]|uniref:Predicted metal-dependent hydrolase, TIM-barrel fold n=1 Tax=Parafrankia irregularis TaxID=795642 RepID=A0A0S4QLT4_9ACTN|nr:MULTISPECIES: amidohydrolase family protein [Parafrankia]MBE3200179.1 amidohydrolase [Parafrankia sp. CH37]CUU56629.1 Predicted metal-dependent hydrolase, TIM-barrel fold [Parafrankia irregularis]